MQQGQPVKDAFSLFSFFIYNCAAESNWQITHIILLTNNFSGLFFKFFFLHTLKSGCSDMPDMLLLWIYFWARAILHKNWSVNSTVPEPMSVFSALNRFPVRAFAENLCTCCSDAIWEVGFLSSGNCPLPDTSNVNKARSHASLVLPSKQTGQAWVWAHGLHGLVPSIEGLIPPSPPHKGVYWQPFLSPAHT